MGGGAERRERRSAGVVAAAKLDSVAVRSHFCGEDPLGMSNTFTDIPAEHEGDRFATGYARLNRLDERPGGAPFFQARGIAPAAGFASSVEDLACVAS